MRYDHQISFITPIAHLETARAVSRAFDPDVGGADAFQMMLSSDGKEPATHAAYSTPCTEEFVGFLELHPFLIHGMVAEDYAARWSGIKPPTLEAISAFMSVLIATPNMDILQAIENNNLKQCALLLA